MNPRTPTQRNDSFDVLTIYNPSDEPFDVFYNSELHATIQPRKALQLVKLIAGDGNHGAIKHLIDRMCRLQGKQRNEPSVRAAWFEKIVLNQKTSSLPKIPDVIDLARQANRELAQQQVDLPTPSIDPQPSLSVPADDSSENAKYIASGFKFHPVTGVPLTAATPVITPDQVDTAHVEMQTGTAATPITAPLPAAPLPHPDPATNAILQGIRTPGSNDGTGKVIGEEIDPGSETPYVPEKNWPEAPTKEDLLRYAKDVVMMNVDDPKTRSSLESQTVDQLKDTLKYDVYA